MSSRLAARAAARSWSRSARLPRSCWFSSAELGHLLPELADVIGLAEAGLAPDLLAESLGEAVLELADAGGQAGGALVGGEQVGLQRGPGDGGSVSRPGGRLGLAGMDLGEQVAVPVEEGAVDPGPAGDRGHADLFAGPGGRSPAPLGLAADGARCRPAARRPSPRPVRPRI